MYETNLKQIQSFSASIIFRPGIPWEEKDLNSIRVLVAGTLNSIDCLDRMFADGEPNIEKIARALLNEHTSFAVIIECKKYILVGVDRLRSIPIFVGRNGRETIISNNAHNILDVIKVQPVDWNAVTQFLLSGYIHGNKTLYESIEAPSGGTFLVIEKDSGVITEQSYYKYLPKPSVYHDRNELIYQFGKTLDNSIDRTIAIADQRPIWVPLSGGLDSRLVLAKLKEKNYPDLNCFTYGIGGNHEILMARRTAELLDVPWQFIRSNVRTLKKLYNSEERKRYADYADGLVTVPAYVEYEAFSKIAEENIIPKDSLIVNGQSGDYLFGGHVPASLYSTDKLEDVVDYIVRKHCMHWPELLEYDHESRLYRSIETQLQNQIVEQGQHGQDLLLALYEFWEWSERQPKATVNNQRLYEFFGYQWALPLWDAEMMDFWAKVPYEEKLNQKLHQDYLRSYNYQGVFDRGRAPQKAFVGHHSWVIWLARVLGSVGGSVWKDRFYEHMFFYTYFRAQLGLFGRPFYIQNYKKTRRPRVVAFGARFRLHELGILGMDEANLPLIEP